MLALSLLGAFELWRIKLSPSMRTGLLAVLVMSGTHLAALMSSQGTYAGIRHALPLVFALALLAGGAFTWAWQARSRLTLATASGLLLAGLAMTARREATHRRGTHALATRSADRAHRFGLAGGTHRVLAQPLAGVACGFSRECHATITRPQNVMQCNVEPCSPSRIDSAPAVASRRPFQPAFVAASSAA